MPTIRPYLPGDELGIVRLFSAVFHHELSLAAWQWKYLRDDTPPPVFVAEVDGQIVCHYGALHQRLSWEGRGAGAWDIVDVMCHPRYQGRGLFRRAAQAFITQLCTQQDLFIYGFPGERHRRLGELLIGYEPIAPVYKLQKTLSSKSPSFPAGVVVLQSLPPDWDTHWYRLEKRFPLVAIRDRRALTWRYLMRPEKRYRLLTVPGIPSLAVIGIDLDKAYLMEFVLEEGDEASAQLLLLAVESVCRAEGTKQIEAWFARFAWECRFLNGPGGFCGTAAENYFECRIFDQRLRASWLAEHFYYSLGDYDVF